VRVPDAAREAQNEVFSQQLYYCGLLAAAFHAKHGSVKMKFRTVSKSLSIHEAEIAEPVAPVEPHVWKQRADEYRRVCDIPPEDCLVVTRYSPDQTGRVGFQRKSWFWEPAG